MPPPPRCDRAPCATPTTSARCHRPDIDHLQGRCFAATFVSSAQGLAIDRQYAGKVQPIELGKTHHEPSKGLLETVRVEQTEHTTESVVTGDAMLQPENLPQQGFLGQSKTLHVRCAFRAAQNRRQRNEQYLVQCVLSIRRPRILQPFENLLELAHPTPLAMWESSSESIL
jgi:hypothetical protein